MDKIIITLIRFILFFKKGGRIGIIAFIRNGEVSTFSNNVKREPRMYYNIIKS